MRDHRAPRALFVLVYLLSGAAALVYEVVWARLLTLQMGSTVTAVGTVLAAFMGGMARGASRPDSSDGRRCEATRRSSC